MTGYGRGEKEALGKRFSLELKSVNHRYLEVSLRHPRKYLKMEEKVRKIISEYIKRGHVEVFVKIKNVEQQDVNVKVDKEVAMTYYNLLNELGQLLKIDNNLSLEKIISLPEIISIEEKEEDIDQIWVHYEEILRDALEQNKKMRIEEGMHLKEDFILRIEDLREMKEKIALRSPLVTQEYKEKLRIRIEELLEKKEIINEDRLENEVAFFSDRSSITEELVRLESHFIQFMKNINLEDQVGRKLDFLIQEMNREINTIGSKANDSEISLLVVEMKAQLEKIREQVQNIE